MVPEQASVLMIPAGQGTPPSSQLSLLRRNHGLILSHQNFDKKYFLAFLVRMSSLGYEKVEPNEDEDGDEEFANQWEVAELAEGGEEEKDDSAIHEFSSVREKVGHMAS